MNAGEIAYLGLAVGAAIVFLASVMFVTKWSSKRSG